MLSHCEVFEASNGVVLGGKARNVWLSENHFGARDAGVVIEPGADNLIVRDNIVLAPEVVVQKKETGANTDAPVPKSVIISRNVKQ